MSDSLTTSLGPNLVPEDDGFALCLDDLPIVHGLSVLARSVSETIVAHAHDDVFEVEFERRILARENPELVALFDIASLRVRAEHGLAVAATRDPEALEDQLRALLGSLQRERYRDALLAPVGGRPLVLDASQDPRLPTLAILEHRAGGTRERGGALRLTLEDPSAMRLDLDALAHIELPDPAERTFIAGTTRIAHTWADALRREAERGARRHEERRRPHTHLFDQLDKAGLGELEQVELHWDDAFAAVLFESSPDRTNHLLKRALLALEDRTVRRLLAQGRRIRVESDGHSVYLDVSRLGRALHLALGCPRSRVELARFLERMPGTSAVAERSDRPLADVSVFLVHHMTGEVLGLIEALRRLGCRDLVCLFVVYGDEAPSSYLDALLELPAHEFCALGLVSVPAEGHVEGAYRLSNQYSRYADAADVDRALARGRARYFEAMSTVAVAAFARQVDRAREAGRRAVVVEDGGYLAPWFNRAVLEGATLARAFAEVGLEVDDQRTVAEFVGGGLVGTVEHTRNGFDRLGRVERDHGRLALPAFSIAVSHTKLGLESKEVSASILSAIETVLHSQGLVLSRRRPLVLGSRGSIGTNLVRDLGSRIDDAATRLRGVDLRVDGRTERDEGAAAIAESTDLAGLGREAWRATDLVIGVTGTSVITGSDVEDWLAGGSGRRLVLASGSTKTVEFADVADWMDGLLQTERPTVADRPVRAHLGELTDPRTQRLYGHRLTIEDSDGGGRNEILLLANLMPINFLFYGVPTESIDAVLAELARATLGMVALGPVSAPRLHAVDRDIDPDGRPLTSGDAGP